MFERLAAEIEALAIPPSGDAIAAVLALRARLDARIAEAVGAFDAAGGWDADAATSAVAWLREHAGLTGREAARLAATARRLRHLPVTRRAWADGALSGGQVEAVVVAVGSRHLERFARHEAEVVAALAGLSVADTAAAMAHWRALAEAADDEQEPAQPPERSLHLSRTLGGTWALDGTLDAASGEVVATAMRLAASPDSPGEPGRSPATRRADALADVCRFFLDHQRHRPAGRHRPHLNVVVDLDALEEGRGGRFVDGAPLDAAGLEALTCDSVVHRVLWSRRSAILDYGAATRTIAAPLWNALVIRDEHCRFPGCDRPATWCEGHHVEAFGRGGPTALDNLVLACARHHHRLHQLGWSAKLLPDATFEVTDPAGLVRTTRPPRAGPARAGPARR